MAFRIRQLITGELESSLDVSLLGSGVSPHTSREEVLPFGFRDDLVRRDGSVVSGVMVPVPVWVIEGARRVTLIDSGLASADYVSSIQARYGIDFIAVKEPEHDLTVGLAGLGIRPQDVEVVVLTHLHFDHVGGLELFPNAEFVVHERELWPAFTAPPWATFYYPEDARRLQDVAGRMRVVADDVRLEPGLDLIHVGGHTPGQMATLVETSVGRVCLASDVMYNYRNLELNWPQGSFWNLGELVRGYDRLRSEADIIIPQHDWEFRRHYPDGTVG